MTQPQPPVPAPALDDAKRQYVELFGSALVMNTYLKVALLLVSLVAAGLVALNYRTQLRYEHLKPLVIRIDDVGMAEAVTYDSLTYQPRGQAPELKYFLMQFIAKHFSRIRICGDHTLGIGHQLLKGRQAGLAFELVIYFGPALLQMGHIACSISHQAACTQPECAGYD